MTTPTPSDSSRTVDLEDILGDTVLPTIKSTGFITTDGTVPPPASPSIKIHPSDTPTMPIDTDIIPPSISDPVTMQDTPAAESTLPFKTQQVLVEQVWTSPTEWKDEADTLSMPSNFDQAVSQNLLNTPKINLVDSPEGRKWATVLQDGIDLTVAENGFIPSLENKDSEWRQFVPYNGQELRGRQPNLGGGAANQVLTGERAVLQILTHVGTGTIFQVPLWHTGIWLTLKPPLETELVELNRMLVSQKIELGRYTYGLAFSNSIVYTVEHLMDFALRHVYDASIKLDVSDTRALKDLILAQDIPSVLWGLACTLYPKGFQYRRACMQDPATCNHVVEELMNLRKLLWTNRAALTDWQRAHMASWRSASKDLESVKKYQEEMLQLNDFTIKLQEGTEQEMRIILKSPTVSDYVDSGHRWINGIVDLVDKVLAAQNKAGEREKLITQHGQATAMRQYTHWIRSIEFDHHVVNGEEIHRTVEDREAIEKVCDALSGDDGIRNHFMQQVGEYINQSTQAVVGIPTYDCPACQATQESTHQLPHHRNIIPLDVIQTFFALLTQRISRIVQR